MFSFIPKDNKFFDMFVEMSINVTAGARELNRILSDGAEVRSSVQRVKEFEHRGDELTHQVLKKLNKTFITPFDREDIHRLASSIDDVLDFINAAAQRMQLYKITSPPPSAGQLSALIIRQSEELTKALSALEKNQSGVLESCVEINRLEEEADEISRTAIGNLFENESDPINLIKLKELFEVLETATDKVEDAANVLEGVVLKSA
jgi:predicted phosphate transport protein (TIGR00153 family)